MRRLTLALGLVALGLTSSALVAHVRLHNPGNGNPLFWPVPGSISIVTSSIGSDDIADGSHETSIRGAYRTWNDVGSGAVLVEDSSPASQARTDWQSSGIHLVLFDESNTSGFFPGGSGIVAITPVFFFSSGAIADADILFNGSQFSFSTNAASTAMDVEDVVTHELGHLLGLDHTGVGGGSMYPFVSGTVTAHRSLSRDDVNGLRSAYPAATFATITGRILRLSDSSAVPGAYVVARDADGRTHGSDLSDAAGNFAIVGLDAGTYTVYASPLDAPVSAGNLTAGHAVQTDFEPALYGATAVVGATDTVAMGDLFVDADVALNLGIAGEALPVTAIADGVTRSLLLRGSGLVAGSTFTVSDPTLTAVPTLFLGTQVRFDLTVPIGTPPGHVDATFVNGSGDLAILPGAIEIVPPAPTIATVTPGAGQAAGGTAVTIAGTGFRSGARVVIGDRLYVDGDVGGATVVDANTITLTTGTTVVGTHDVVVIDSTGVEARAASAFQAAQLPVIDSTFPTAGASVGGTEVTITGENFFAGVQVRIDGVTQTSVALESSSVLRFTAEAGIPGGPYTLEVDVGGAIATSAFTYALQADPDVQVLTPSTGTAAGGDTIQITGSGFTADTTVTFGADEDTGAGGTPAQSVTFVDANTLEVVTPAHAAGAASVTARDTSTGQAELVAAAFSFDAVSNGGGGGGCQTRFVPAGPTPRRDAILGAAWLALLAAYLGLRARRAALAASRP